MEEPKPWTDDFEGRCQAQIRAIVTGHLSPEDCDRAFNDLFRDIQPHIFEWAMTSWTLRKCDLQTEDDAAEILERLVHRFRNENYKNLGEFVAQTALPKGTTPFRGWLRHTFEWALRDQVRHRLGESAEPESTSPKGSNQGSEGAPLAEASPANAGDEPRRAPKRLPGTYAEHLNTEQVGQLAATYASMTERLSRRDQLALALRRVQVELSARHRDILVARLGGATFQEIADEHKLSGTRVKQLYADATKVVREVIQDFDR